MAIPACVLGCAAQSIKNSVRYQGAVVKATTASIAGLNPLKFVLNTRALTINNGGRFFVTESQDLTEIDVNDVPEPSPIALLAIGSAALLHRRRCAVRR